MRAITVIPGQPGSVALTDMPEPPPRRRARPGPDPGDRRLRHRRRDPERRLRGTPRRGANGWPSSGTRTWGACARAPAGSGFAAGNLVISMVRRPESRPLRQLRQRRMGHVQERPLHRARRPRPRRLRLRALPAGDRVGIAVHVPAALGNLAVLVEPTTIVAKAWEQIERIGRRSTWSPREGTHHRRRAHRAARRPAVGPARLRHLRG